MNRRHLISANSAAGVVLAASAAPNVARADDSLSVLDRIQRDKKVRITAEVDSPPFGIPGQGRSAKLPEEPRSV
jgi:hypothetical protein